MLAELTRQEQDRGLPADQAQSRAQRRVRAFLRRTIEGCQRLAKLDHDYNLRASVRHGATIAAMNDADMAGLEASYDFMEDANFRALMPVVGRRHAPFFARLSAGQVAAAVWDRRGFLRRRRDRLFRRQLSSAQIAQRIGAALQKTGVRFFQHTEAQALDFPDHRVTVFCENGAAIQADRVFMANAYARHINGDALERAIFLYDYVVVVELPERSDILASDHRSLRYARPMLLCAPPWPAPLHGLRRDRGSLA